MYVCIYLRVREHMHARVGRGAEEEGDSQADSMLSAELNVGLDPTTLGS